MRNARAAMMLAMIGMIMSMLGTSCPHREKLYSPTELRSPYPATKLFAVVPLRNESGTSVADGARLADHLVQQLQQVRGVEVIPVNRVIQAMQAYDLPDVRSFTQATALMQELAVDGLIVGTITAYDPYDPPKIGATIQLYQRQYQPHSNLDPRELTAATVQTRPDLPGLTHFNQPATTVSDHYDAANHAVLKSLKLYAEGRVPPGAAGASQRYLMDMDLYTEFVSYQMVRRLLEAEWTRIAADPTASRTVEER